MEERFDKLDTKLDKLSDKLESIDKTLVRQEEQLAYHIKRTDLAEKNIDKLRAEIQPVKDHVNGIKFIGKIVMWLSVVLSVITGVAKVLKLF